MTTTPLITRDVILQHARLLPAAAQVMAGLGELLQDVNTDLDQIAEEIRLDPALAGRVIQISNSLAFGGGERVGSIEEAVNRVGFSEVLRLVGIATVAGLADQALVCYKIPAERLRESLLFHALAAEVLADATGFDHRAAYSAGLLHGVGLMVIERIGRRRLVPAKFYDAHQFQTYTQWESEHFGVSGTEVATCVLDEWQFPAEIVSGIQRQFLLNAESRADRFACLLNLAGGIVSAHGLALPGEAAHWVVEPEKLEAAGLSAADLDSANAQARAQFDRQRAALF